MLSPQPRLISRLTEPIAPDPPTPVSMASEAETSSPTEPVEPIPEIPVTSNWTLPLPETPKPSDSPSPDTPV